VAGWSSEKPAAEPAVQWKAGASPRLDGLLRRMVAERASDVHLSGGQRPRWRIDGDMHVITDLPPLSSTEVFELLEPVLRDANKEEYAKTNDTDFSYAIEGVSRFRVNLYRDNGGVGAVFRAIPDKILTIEQLNLPSVVQTICDYPKGLVLVTGPTGSGKSTTLAAMIDYINRSQKAHIITLEDPIEFVHKSNMALVNQREVGPHTDSFGRALRAALREDPDIVLVGEMRDLETVAMALETANTGHLVFGTLHTSTAISTVDRIVDLFPSGQQNQIRVVLADTLRAVVSQCLLRKVGGGRVAALEILISNMAVANLVREGKNQQIASIMSTQKALGNRLLNEELAVLVKDKVVEYEEALSAALDKPGFAKLCGQPPPKV
jgi:twitching motility protein PilT